MPEIMKHVSDEMLLSMAQEAIDGGEELETALSLIRREMGFRGLVMVVPDTTGAIDALADTEGMVEPQHTDSLWAAWNEPHESPKWLQAPERGKD